MAGEEAVPVWGIEVGSRLVRAVRVARRPEDGYVLLDYREGPISAPGPEGLVAFVRRHRLWGHPLVLAIDSPSTRFRTVALSPAEASGDDPRSALLEYVHPEPELIELHSREVGTNLHLLAAEDRARVESFLIALERADLPAYALMPALPAVDEAVRRSGLFVGDGVLLHLTDAWVDLVFLDGDSVRHLALPVGPEELATEEGRAGFADDFTRLLEYHRTRRPREEAERIVLLGFPPAVAEALAPKLPARPIPFPGEAGPLRGKGRISLLRAMEIVRQAPAAVGAGIAGAASPRRLELALRPLPDPLPKPPQPIGAWLLAAALVLLAVGVAWFGVDRENRRLRDGLAFAPDANRVSAAEAAEVRREMHALRRRLAWRETAGRILDALPGEDAAPWSTRSLEISRDGDGFAGRLEIFLPARADEDPAKRVAAARSDLPAGVAAKAGETEGGLLLRIRTTEEDR